MIDELTNPDFYSCDIQNYLSTNLWNGREIKLLSSEDTITVSITWEFKISIVRIHNWN